VILPRPGTRLPGNRLRVRGETHPANRIEVNGRPVTVADGVFDIFVPLPAGQSTVTVEAFDPQGNVGRARTSVLVPATQHFLLAVAEAAAGEVHARLDLERKSPILEGDRIFGTGRAAVFYQGRIEGRFLAERMFVTASLDTDRGQRHAALVREVIDPQRSYAVYGDDSGEQVLAPTRRMLYVLVEADESRAVLGAFRTGVAGISLFRFDRTLDGELAEVRREWRAGWATAATAFASRADTPGGHGHDVLRGTGGSLYYLRQRPLLEGSEQVRIQVRDRDRDLVLLEQPLTRGRDYEIRPVAGRLLLRRPLPSVAEPGSLPLPAGPQATLLVGHPVYLVVDYEHEASTLAWSRGVQARQEIAGIVEVTGTLLDERQDDADYALRSAGVVLTPVAGLRLELERATSEGTESSIGTSADGGLTFSGLGGLGGLGGLALGREPSTARRELADLGALGLSLLPLSLGADSLTGLGSLAPSSGTASWARLQGDLGQILDVADRLPRVDLYYRAVDAGFSSTLSQADRGRTRYGFSLLQPLGPADRLLFSHDHLAQESVLGSLGLVGAGAEAVASGSIASRAGPQLDRTSFQYRHTTARWNALFQLDHLRQETASGLVDPDATTLTTTTGLAAGITRRVTPWLDLFLAQQLVQGGEEGLYPGLAERLASTVGVTLALGPDLRLSLAERFRFSGGTSTQLGLMTRLDDGSDVYVQQRYSATSSLDGFGTALLLGAQRADTDGGRSWSELQVANGEGLPRARSLVGLGRRWPVTSWLALDGGFEHGQVSSLEFGEETSDALSLGADVRWGKLLATARYEARLLDREGAAGGQDQRQLLAFHRLQLPLGPAATLHLRGDLSETRTPGEGVITARLAELVTGVAYRPAAQDWFSLLLQYAHLTERTPITLRGGEVEETDADVISLVPVIRTPWRLTLIEKLAYRHARERSRTLPESSTDLLLLILRGNLRLVADLEVAGEWRLRSLPRAKEQERGYLAEVAYVVAQRVRIAAGYNFTSFGDDELRWRDQEAGGFFCRLGAQL
jgi:hypothetical protein